MPRLGGTALAPPLAHPSSGPFPSSSSPLIYFSPKHIISASTAVTGLLALGLLAIAARWPDRALIALIVLIPFQELLLAKLWALGAPTSIVRHLSAWKEAFALGIVVAGARNFIATGRRADALDRLGLGFVLVALVYLGLQHEIIPSAPSSSSIRLLGFREDAGFVLLLLGARHAPLPAGFLERIGRVALLVAAVVAGIAIFEALDSTAWNHFVVYTLRYTVYEVGILHTNPVNFSDIRTYNTIAGHHIIRVGSVFLNPLTLGFYLVLGFAIALERSARGRARPWVIVSLLMIAAALLMTQTRSAILAALVVALLALQPASGRSPHWRAQLAILIAAVALVAVPTAFATHLSQRVTTANTADNAGHVTSFWQGLSTVIHHPLGQGLGTSAGTGQRFASTFSQLVIPENTYLQYGVELGIVPMLMFAALSVTLVLKARAAARRYPHYLIAASAGAIAGLAIGAWFLQPWTDISAAWSVWGLTGAALGASRARRTVSARASSEPGSVSTRPSPAAA